MVFIFKVHFRFQVFDPCLWLILFLLFDEMKNSILYCKNKSDLFIQLASYSIQFISQKKGNFFFAADILVYCCSNSRAIRHGSNLFRGSWMYIFAILKLAKIWNTVNVKSPFLAKFALNLLATSPVAPAQLTIRRYIDMKYEKIYAFKYPWAITLHVKNWFIE